MQVKVDLHVHTIYSHDSLITPKDLVFYAKKRGLTAVAITDHDTIEGALKITKEIDFLIIPGIEISSRNGHIVGLNLQEPIPRDLSVEETVDKIHDAGGIAIACHPFAPFKGSLGKHTNAKFNAIETINASAFFFNRCTKKAQEIADRFGLPRVGGTDAHYGPAVGYAYTLIDAEPQVDAISKAITKGFCQPFGKPIPVMLKLEKQIKFLKNSLE